MIAVGCLKSTEYISVSAFSVAAIIWNPDSLRKYTALLKFDTFEVYILSRAPADVFIASALTAAPPFAGRIIPETPAHSADLAMAPKLRTSLTPSKRSTTGALSLL